jgi:hypothetical protein
MQHLATVLALSLFAVWLAQRLWRRWRLAQLQAQRQLAMLEFPALRAALQAQFMAAAAATGKPRGLRWVRCDLHEGELFATDQANGELYALVGTTIGFEAIAGGGMEEVEAVSNLRCATALFVHREGAWITDGRTVFNLEPEQALQHYQQILQRHA